MNDAVPAWTPACRKSLRFIRRALPCADGEPSKARTSYARSNRRAFPDRKPSCPGILLPERILSPSAPDDINLPSPHICDMKRGVHLVLGGIAFLLYAVTIRNIAPAVPEPVIPGIIAALAGSLAPDCLEPPTSWHHRGICHSKRALWFTGILIGLTFAGQVLPVPSETPTGFPVLWTMSCFFLGYFSHLLADACTKMGLPD